MIGAGVVAVLLGAALAVVALGLNRFLTANREWVEAEATAALGRRVAFQSLEATILGGVGATVHDVRIADDPRFSDGDFLTAKAVTLRVRVLPALWGHYEVRGITVDQPRITLVRTADGFNVQTLGGTPAPTQGGGTTHAGGATVPARVPEFLVGLLGMRDGEVRLVDRTTTPPAETTIRGLDVEVSDLSLTAPLHLVASAAVLGAAERNLRAKGTIGPIGDPPTPLAAPIDLALTLGPIDLTALRRDVPLAASAIPADVTVGGTAVGDGHVTGTLERLALTGALDATTADLRYGTTFRKPVGMPLHADVAATRSGDAIDLAKLGLTLADLRLDGRGRIVPGSPTTVDLQIDGARTPLAGWDRLLPAFEGVAVDGTFESHLAIKGPLGGDRLPSIDGSVALAGVSARKQGAPYQIDGLTGTMTFSGDRAELPPTTFQLGGAPVQVAARVESFAVPKAHVDLSAAALPAAALGVAAPGVTAPEILRGLALALDLRTENGAPVVAGTVASASGSVRDLAYEDLKATLGYAAGIATADDLAFRAYGGTYAGRVRVDARDAKAPRFESRSTVRGMSVEQLAATRAPAVARSLAGRLDADLTLSGAGTWWDALQHTLRGSGRAEVRDGMLRGVNLADEVLSGVGGAGTLVTLVPEGIRRKHPELFGADDTRFDQLGGSFTIADGVARTTDAIVAARDYTIHGAGTVTLNGRVDMKATFTASDALTRDITAAVHEARYLADDRGRIALPFGVAGIPPSLRVEPDASVIARALQRGLAEKGVEALLGGKKGGKPNQAEDAIRKGLQGLFGGR